jgi:hypothetical protein
MVGFCTILRNSIVNGFTLIGGIPDKAGVS